MQPTSTTHPPSAQYSKHKIHSALHVIGDRTLLGYWVITPMILHPKTPSGRFRWSVTNIRNVLFYPKTTLYSRNYIEVFLPKNRGSKNVLPLYFTYWRKIRKRSYTIHMFKVIFRCCTTLQSFPPTCKQFNGLNQRWHDFQLFWNETVKEELSSSVMSSQHAASHWSEIAVDGMTSEPWR